MATFYKKPRPEAPPPVAIGCCIIARFKIISTKLMKKSFATLPQPAMWVFSALLGVSGAMDLAAGLTGARPAELLFAIGPLLMSLFLAWCALQRRACREALLASPRVTLVGYVCFGLFVGGFVVKLALRGTTLAIG